MRKAAALLLCALSSIPLSAQEPRLSSGLIGPKDAPEALLTLSRAARVSVSAKSSIGVPIALLDRMEGRIAAAGEAGATDGRIDISLDPGEYLLRLEDRDAPGKSVALSARSFRELGGEDSSAWPRLVPGEVASSSLEDLQSASYWIELREDGAVEAEALGRGLSAMEIWREGQYLVGSYPAREERQPAAGRPMGYACASVPAKAGLYCLRLYGGPGRPWKQDGGKSPLFVRSGFIPMPAGGKLELAVSPFGRDFVLVEDADAAVLARKSKGAASLAAIPYAPGVDRLGASDRAVIKKDAPDLRCSLGLPRGKALVSIEAQVGDQLGLDAFRAFAETSVPRDLLKSGGLLTLVAARSAAPELPITGIAYRVVDRKAVVAKDFAQPLSGSSPIRARFNLGASGARSMYLRVEEAGDYQVAEKGGTGQGAAVYSLRSLGPGLSASGDSPSREGGKSTVFSLVRGYYLLGISAKSFGVLDFALFKNGPARGAVELGKEPPANRGSLSWAIAPDADARDLFLLAGSGPSGGSGYAFAPFPLELGNGIALELGAGESLELPASLAERSVFRRGSKQGSILLGGQEPTEGAALAAGKRSLVLRNPGAAPATLAFSMAASYDDRPAPRATAFGAGTSRLAAGKAEWRDFGRSDSAVYSFEVAEPAVYVVETLGRLSTSLSLRTASRLGLFEAAANGYGKNASIRAWLRPGQYYVQAGTKGSSTGRGGIRLDRVPLAAEAALDLGSVDRRSLPADSAARFSFALASEEELELRSTGLASSFAVRLEDERGFPVYRGEGKARLRLAAGRYRLFSLPVSIDTNRLTWIRRIAPATPAAALPGTMPLALNVQSSSTWSGERAEDIWSIAVPSALEARLALPEAFEVRIEGPGGARKLGPKERGAIALERGSYALAVRPRDATKQLRYSIAVSTSVLAPGVAGIAAPGNKASSAKVSVPEDGFYELWSLGRSDVAARLYREGADSAPVAVSDDNGPDWNFDIVQRLKAGSYRLELDSIAGSSEPVELYLTSRKAKAAPVAAAPFEGRLAMDESGVLLPFDAKAGEGFYRLSAAGDSPVSLRLYRGEELVAAGEGELALPLRGGARYSLYAWTSFPAEPLLSLRKLPEKEASVSAPFALGPGEVARLRNAEAMSAKATSGRLLVSPALEVPCYDPGDSPFSASASGGWAWAPEAAASAAPLALAEGEGALLLLGDVGQGFAAAAPDKALLVSVDTRGQFRCGISARPASAAPGFDWDSSASWSQGSVALLPPGSWKARVWDGERELAKRGLSQGATATGVGSDSRRVGLGLEALELKALPAIKQGDRDTITVPAGSAVAMDAPACTLSVLMAKGLALSAWKDGDALATRVSLDGKSSETLSLKACRLVVANRGAADARLRYAVLPARSLAEDELSSARPFEAVGLPPEGVRLQLKAAEGELLCLAGDAAVAELECSDGRYLRIERGSASGLFASAPASAGALRLRSAGGLVRAYLAKAGKELDGLVAQEGSSGRELVDAAILSGKGDAFKLRMAQAGYVDLSCPGPGILALGGAGVERRVAVSGSREDMHLFAWLPAGDYALWQRPARGTPGGGMLRAERVASRDATAGAAAFIGAREYQAWSFEVKAAGKVGIGVKSEADGLEGFLYDSRQGLVARGSLLFSDLKTGGYVLVVKGLDSAPTEYSLVLAGLDGSRVGVPPDVVSKYKSAGGVPASVLVPMRLRSPRAPARQVQARSPEDGEGEGYAEGDDGSGDEGEVEGGDGGSGGDEYEGDDGGGEGGDGSGDQEYEGDGESEGDYDGE